MKADPTVISNLQTAAGLEAHLAGQYQVDVRCLKALGLDWLEAKTKKWYSEAEDFLRCIIDRLLFFDQDVQYSAGEVSSADSITTFLERSLELENAAVDQYQEFCAQAWEVRDDGTRNLYEHLIKWHEQHIFKLKREVALIDKLGGEGEYLSARLEDA